MNRTEQAMREQDAPWRGLVRGGGAMTSQKVPLKPPVVEILDRDGSSLGFIIPPPMNKRRKR